MTSTRSTDDARRAGRRRTTMVALGLVLVLASFAPMGCAGPKAYGSLAVRAVTDDPVELKCTFTEAWFRPADAGTSFYLSDVPLDTLLSGRPGAGQIMHIELMWLPRPGRTPVDPSATNISIRLIVFAENEVGVYGGAGFAWVKGKNTGKRMTLSIEEASLSLMASTDGFNDLLTPSLMSGRITAIRDESAALRLRQAASQVVTDVFGESRYVMRGDGGSWAAEGGGVFAALEGGRCATLGGGLLRSPWGAAASPPWLRPLRDRDDMDADDGENG